MDTSILSHINWLAVLAAAIVYFLLGALWYSNAFLGPRWAALAGVKREDPEAAKNRGRIMGLSFVLFLLICTGMALLIYRLQLYAFTSGIKMGLITGLLFSATTIAISNLYQGKSMNLTAIDSLYHVIGQIVAGVIIVLWK
jgi:MFS family permease